MDDLPSLGIKDPARRPVGVGAQRGLNHGYPEIDGERSDQPGIEGERHRLADMDPFEIRMPWVEQVVEFC